MLLLTILNKIRSYIQPNPANLISQLADGANEASSDSDSEPEQDKSHKKKSSKESGGSGLYVPPKLSAVHYGGEDTKAERNRKQLERAKKRALR